jgi:glycerol-3-phosphate acyltransferase PlsY
MLLGVAPTEFLVSIVIFAVVLYASRYVSLGSIAAAVAFPLSLVVRYNIFMDEIPSYHTLVYFSVGVALFLIYSHRTNIRRLIAGTENKITRSSGKQSAES